MWQGDQAGREACRARGIFGEYVVIVIMMHAL